MMDQAGTQSAWDDPRIRAAMPVQLASRDESLGGGARRVGWKFAFGTPAAKARWGISGPVIGFLTDATLLSDGAERSVGGWTAPRLEAEVVVRVSAGPAGHFRPDGLGIAIELADLGELTESLEEVVAGNIFHRGMVTGPIVPVDEVEGDVVVTVSREGEILGQQDRTAESVGGDPATLTAYATRFLEAFGEELRDGDLLLTGAVVPPIDCAEGGGFRVDSPALGSVEIKLAA